jgi:hypothetical protein
MERNTTLQNLKSTDARERLRAMFMVGINGTKSALPTLQDMMQTDPIPELRQAAGATVLHIERSAKLDNVKDAKADLAWTREFLQFLSMGANFSPADVQDLAMDTSEDAMKLVEAAQKRAEQDAERERSQLVTGATYEMLWTCDVCGTEGLLGVSNRFCPNCGAAQDPRLRYFPEPGEYHRLVNHKYEGVDVICPACETPNSAATNFCVSCGADVKTGEKADVRIAGTPESTEARDLDAEHWSDMQQRMGVEPTSSTASSLTDTRKKRRRQLQIGGVFAVILALLGGTYGAFFHRISEEATITGHQWERKYNIEEYQAVRSERECPAPSGAYNISRSTRTRQVSYQEEVCSQQNVDQGDGSFRVEEVCRSETRYRDEQYESCSYTFDQWVDLNEEREAPWAVASGTNLNPVWPNIDRRNVEQCSRARDRLGTLCWDGRSENFKLTLRRDNGSTAECEIDQLDTWRSWQNGERVRVNFTFFSRARGRALCNEMERIP